MGCPLSAVQAPPPQPESGQPAAEAAAAGTKAEVVAAGMAAADGRAAEVVGAVDRKAQVRPDRVARADRSVRRP